MARGEAHIKTSIWDDGDWLTLQWEAQWLYLAILSQRDLSWCGVLTWSPGRIARKAGGLTRAKVEHARKLLVNARFVVLDEETDELWVRRFVRHEKVCQRGNVLLAACHDFLEIHSRQIRAGLVEQLRDGLPDGPPPELRKKLPEGLSESLPEWLPQGTPPRDLGKGLPQGTPPRDLGKGLPQGTPPRDLGECPLDHGVKSKEQTPPQGSAGRTEGAGDPVEEEDESLRSEPKPTDTDDLGALVQSVACLVADRRLARRAEPPMVPSRWARKTADGIVTEYGDRIETMLAKGLAPEHVADAIDRPVNGEAVVWRDCCHSTATSEHKADCESRQQVWDVDETGKAVRR